MRILKTSKTMSWHYNVLFGTLFVMGACSKEEAIPVKAKFSIEVVDEDYSAPVQVKIINDSEGADTYLWTFVGGTPSTSTDRNPGTILYFLKGNFTIKLHASNQDNITDQEEVTVIVDEEIIIGFEAKFLVDSFPPMEVRITNKTVGAETYRWTFDSGIPATSTLQHPDNVVFNEPGEYVITLDISNRLETHQIQKTVTVAPHLEVGFNYEVAFEDEDWQAPVKLKMVNTSISASNYTWTFYGGIPQKSTDQNPTVVFKDSGSHKIELIATNGKETLSSSKHIKVHANTNIYSVQNIQLGINTAHNANIGAFFSTSKRKVYNKAEAAISGGQHIDIAFFGLNQNFTFNKFVSPDMVQSLTFDQILNASHTKFINLLESCNCSASMTVDQFDAITNDEIFRELTITETKSGLQDFNDATVPRIVLFENDQGRKGAIKIKNFVNDELNSYIIVDIKVQKKAM